MRVVTRQGAAPVNVCGAGPRPVAGSEGSREVHSKVLSGTLKPTGAPVLALRVRPVVAGWLVGVGEKYASSAVGGELVVGAGDRIVFGAGDPRSVLAFGIGDLPGIIGQRPRDVPGVSHHAITTAVSCRGAAFELLVAANSVRGLRAGSALTPAACSTRCTRGAALTRWSGSCRWAA